MPSASDMLYNVTYVTTFRVIGILLELCGHSIRIRMLFLSQAAGQGLAVLMASAVVVLKHETSTIRKGTILYQSI